jgi:hypothetical protein
MGSVNELKIQLHNEVTRLCNKIYNRLEGNKESGSEKIKLRLIEIEEYLKNNPYDLSYMAASRDWLQKVLDTIKNNQ